MMLPLNRYGKVFSQLFGLLHHEEPCDHCPDTPTNHGSWHREAMKYSRTNKVTKPIEIQPATVQDDNAAHLLPKHRRKK